MVALDILADRKHIAAGVEIIAALANRYIRTDAGLTDEMGSTTCGTVWLETTDNKTPARGITK